MARKTQKLTIEEFYSYLEGYARQNANRAGSVPMVRAFDDLRNGRATGDVERATHAALSIGYYVYLDLADPAGGGLRSLKGSVVGGKNRSTATRDVALAQEYDEELSRKSTGISATELMRKIGARHGLKPKAAIAAIDRGLKLLQQKSSKTGAT